ncbi:MAG: glutamyl-tRNA reductase [Acidimicrobiaceae bacterium]|nr:glutamyl-tRNA reductase [Acidimicrobiaceae bacterium]
MALIAVGLDHENASLDLLERAAVLEHEWVKVLRTLVSHRNIHEAVFVSTCLRTEVVAVIDRFHGAIDEITATLSEATGLAASEFEEHLSVHFDRGVANHIFSVAAGLRSVVPGEFEILGQLRRALELANDEHVAGPTLTELFQKALTSGRRVRNETSIARGTTSFAYAAVETTLESLGEEAGGSTAVVVGAGQLATGVVRSLLASPVGIGRVVICNRTLSRAEELIRTLSDERVVVSPLEELHHEVAFARSVVVAVEVSAPLITLDTLRARTTPLLVMDLAVPRGVARDVETLSSVRRIDIGTLHARVNRALDDRRDAVTAAEAIVAADVEKYLEDQRARGAAVIVSDLRAHFDTLVAAEFSRRASEIDTLSDDGADLLRSVVRSVVAKIAHRPTTALKEAAGTDQGARLSEAVRTLFDI